MTTKMNQRRQHQVAQRDRTEDRAVQSTLVKSKQTTSSSSSKALPHPPLTKRKTTEESVTKIHTTEDIEKEFGGAFDMTKYLSFSFDYDDRVLEQPLRIIKHWYLATSRNVNAKRYPLPLSSNTFQQNPNQSQPTETAEPKNNILKLYGWLQPIVVTVVEGQDSQEPIFVEIDDLNVVCIDRSRCYRGYWIATAEKQNEGKPALYWLQEPDTYRPTLCDQQDDWCSQEEVHLEARAMLGVISNLIDYAFPIGDEYEDYTSNEKGEDTTSPNNPEKMARSNAGKTYTGLIESLPKHTLQKDLLVHYRHEIIAHLRGHHAALTEKCRFLQSLKKISCKSLPNFDQSKEHYQNDLLVACVAAENRSRQHPWGESKGAFVPETMKEKTTVKDNNDICEQAVNVRTSPSATAKQSIENLRNLLKLSCADPPPPLRKGGKGTGGQKQQQEKRKDNEHDSEKAVMVTSNSATAKKSIENLRILLKLSCADSPPPSSRKGGKGSGQKQQPDKRKDKDNDSEKAEIVPSPSTTSEKLVENLPSLLNLSCAPPSRKGGKGTGAHKQQQEKRKKRPWEYSLNQKDSKNRLLIIIDNNETIDIGNEKRDDPFRCGGVGGEHDYKPPLRNRPGKHHRLSSRALIEDCVSSSEGSDRSFLIILSDEETIDVVDGSNNSRGVRRAQKRPRIRAVAQKSPRSRRGDTGEQQQASKVATDCKEYDNGRVKDHFLNQQQDECASIDEMSGSSSSSTQSSVDEEACIVSQSNASDDETFIGGDDDDSSSRSPVMRIPAKCPRQHQQNFVEQQQQDEKDEKMNDNETGRNSRTTQNYPQKRPRQQHHVEAPPQERSATLCEECVGEGFFGHHSSSSRSTISIATTETQEVKVMENKTNGTISALTELLGKPSIVSPTHQQIEMAWERYMIRSQYEEELQELEEAEELDDGLSSSFDSSPVASPPSCTNNESKLEMFGKCIFPVFD